VKLAVVTGHREYLQPWAPERDALLPLLREAVPTAAIPLTRWPKQPAGDHAFLYTDADRAPARVETFLDYLEEACPPPAVPVVLLPLESFDGAADDRVRQFLAAAGARHGTDMIATVRRALSETSLRVLRRLRELAGEPEPAAAVGEPPLMPDAARHAPLARALQRNYSLAVLQLAEKIVRPADGRGAAQIGELLDRNRLFVRADLDADAVTSALAPGGELYQLLIPEARSAPGRFQGRSDGGAAT
jgi:hypothetical protein